MAARAGESGLLSAKPAVRSQGRVQRGTIVAGQLEIEGHRYFALPERSTGSLSGQPQSTSEPLEEGRAGDLRINGKRYIVVPAEEYPDRTGNAVVERSIDILTKRELQVVMLVAKGCVNKQIADQLKISEWTVSTHLRRIFLKLRVDSRAAMVYRWLEATMRTNALCVSCVLLTWPHGVSFW
jgi:DNA-binding CsgD family transcriptional regulator